MNKSVTTPDDTRRARKKSEKRWTAAGWKRYEDAYEAFRSIVKSAVDGGLQPGQPLPAQFHEALLWLVSGHPQAEEKIGPGVRYFTICVVNPRRRGYARFGFSIVDNRGDERAFELSAALRGTNNTKLHDVKSAFRYEVREQILSVRSQALGLRCYETGETLTEDNCEVDHCGAPFEELLRNFICGWDLQLEHIETRFEPGGVVKQHMLVDREMAASWFAFHQRFAKLQALSVEGHRRRTEERRNNPLYGLST